MAINYWVLSPCNPLEKKLFSRVWEYDLNNNTVQLGWPSAGEINFSDKDAPHKLISSKWPGLYASTITEFIWDFHHNVKAGDELIIHQGGDRMLGRARVKGPASFEPGRLSIINDSDRLA